MKELSIKEKAYDGNYKVYTELINRLENVKNAIKKQNYGIAMDILYKPYPEYQITTSTELKECEDLRITKAIKYGLDHVFTNNTTVFEVTKEQCLSWLEKQGEHSNFLSKIQVGDKVTRNEDGVLVNLSQLNRVAKKDEKQGEQKPTNNQFTTEQASVLDKHIDKFLEKKSAWSEKYIADVFEMVRLAKIVREQSNDNLTNALQDAMIELSKFLPQQKQEWSEEDEKMYNVVHDLAWEAYKTSRRLDIPTFGIINDWLKSLKERVQPKVELTQLDKNILEAAIAFVEQNNHFNCWRGIDKRTVLSALHSLRPQNTWKPSDEQLNALRVAIGDEQGSDCCGALRDLLKDLKSL